MRNRLGIFNECTIILCGLLFMCFSDFVGTKEAQYSVGQILIRVIYFNVIVNLLYFSHRVRRIMILFARRVFNHGRVLKNIWTL